MKKADEEVFLLNIRAISIRLEPIPSLRRLSLEISSISPNTKREQAMARGRRAAAKGTGTSPSTTTNTTTWASTSR